MGLFDRLFGRDGGDDGADESEGGTPIYRVLFIDEDPAGKRLLDYRLIIGPHPEGGFAIYRCNEPTHVPSGSGLYLFESGDVVFLESAYRSHLATLLPPERYEDAVAEESDGELMDFPPELTEKNLPERSEWTDDELKELILSIGIAREVDDVN